MGLCPKCRQEFLFEDLIKGDEPCSRCIQETEKPGSTAVSFDFRFLLALIMDFILYLSREKTSVRAVVTSLPTVPSEMIIVALATDEENRLAKY